MRRWLLIVLLLPIALACLWLAVRHRTSAEPAPRVPQAPVFPPPRGTEAAPPAAARPGLGSLFLHVTGPEGRPLAGAKVAVTSEVRQDRREFETNARGSQELLNVPAGHYGIQIRYPGLVGVDAHAVVESGRRSDLQFRMLAGATLHGSVMAIGGGLLPGVRVSLLGPKTKTRLHPDLAATTDAQGRYEILGIPPQALSISFHHPRYRMQVRDGIVLQRPDERQQVDAHLLEGTRIAGRVTDEKGAPIPQAGVLAANECTVAVETDREGRFEILGLGDQAAIVSARARGFGEQWLYRVAPGTTGLEFRLPRGGSLEGRIVADPFPEAQSFVLSRFEPELGAEALLAVRVRVDERGGFVVADIAPGTYWLEVDAPGYERAERQQVTVRSEQVTGDLEVRLRKKS